MLSEKPIEIFSLLTPFVYHSWVNLRLSECPFLNLPSKDNFGPFNKPVFLFLIKTLTLPEKLFVSKNNFEGIFSEDFKRKIHSMKPILQVKDKNKMLRII
jgi:hypothetical protein